MTLHTATPHTANIRALWLLLATATVMVCSSQAALHAETVATSAEVKRSDSNSAWPPITLSAKPWTYWYWMGGAVDESGITRHLQQFHDAGFGGMHIIPVYGVRGAESRYVPFLSPRWMELLRHTVREADRIGMGVDMTCGTGWPFGGPWVPRHDAAAKYVLEEFVAEKEGPLRDLIRPRNPKLAKAQLVVLMAYGPGGETLELTSRVAASGRLDWMPPAPAWRLTAMFQMPTNLPVERAAPGGEGPTLNYFDREALARYLKKFDDAFGDFTKLRVRSMYNDSYENWGANYSPNLFAEFERRRGYDLRAHLPKLDPADASDAAQRLRADYRETMADLIRDDFTATWVEWAHDRNMIVRNEGHGSPGNPLDLYALVDVPETEVFGTSWLEPLGLQSLPGETTRAGGTPEVQVCKFASSAAHVAGRKLCSSETFTWLGDHFKIPLERMKAQADLMFVMGINHIFFHGSAYSPSDAAWPGWLWYASTNVGAYMPAWSHMPALCNYIARCQASLQTGEPDNELLVYLPIYDLWATDEGARDNLQYTVVHSTSLWLEKIMPGCAEIGSTLWNRGYGFDFISDRQIAELSVAEGKIISPGGKYRVLIVPACRKMPDTTLAEVARIAKQGGTILIHKQLPDDVPGLAQLDERRAKLRAAAEQLTSLKRDPASGQTRSSGSVIVGDDLEQLLAAAAIRRESMVDLGLKFVRRRDDHGWVYFIVNHAGESKKLERWVPLSVPASSIVLFDPATGQTGKGAVRNEDGTTYCFLQLGPRQSVIVRAFEQDSELPEWKYLHDQQHVDLAGNWQVEFTAGGPALPEPRRVPQLSDWTKWSGDSQSLENFSGSAKYVLEFNQPELAADGWALDLGEVCHSARVRLNGDDLGTLITSPYRIDATKALRPGVNRLEIEVINLPANRVAELDRRGEDWKKSYFVHITYQPFDASKWSPVRSGLIGPVKLIAQQRFQPHELTSAAE